MDMSYSPVLSQDDWWDERDFYMVGAGDAMIGESRSPGVTDHKPVSIQPSSASSVNDQPTILIVDDEESIAELLADLLGDEGYRVIVARDGAAALACARSAQPAMVLSDCMMPGLDGMEFVREMRRHPATRHIPVALMSSARPKMLRLPDVPFLEKPFDLDDVVALVAQCARRRSFAQLYGEG
jgi:CheY-like chemotaxis protein